MEKNDAPIDVFISRKSEDAALAKQLYLFLTAKGLQVFDSDESLPVIGNSDYRKAIDVALDQCKHMLVIGSSLQNISSSWVEAEWGFYIQEKRAGRKTGNILSVVSPGIRIEQLPPSLRNFEVIHFDQLNFERIASYVTGYRVAGSEGNSTTSPPAPKESGLNLHNYIKKNNADFGKPAIKQKDASSVQHLFSFPAGFSDLQHISPDNAEQVSGIAFHIEGKYFLTYSRKQKGAIIWSLQTGEPVQHILPNSHICTVVFDHYYLLVYTSEFELFTFKDAETNHNLHGIEWRIIKEEEIPVPSKFSEPVITQVVSSFVCDECAILIKDKAGLENQDTSSVILLQTLNSEGGYQGSAFQTLVDTKKDIRRIKRIGKKIFVGIANPYPVSASDGWLFIQGNDTQKGNDIVFIHSVEYKCIAGTTIGRGLVDLDIQSDELENDTNPAVQSQSKTIMWGTFNLAEGGFVNSSFYSWAYLLIALSNRGTHDITVANREGHIHQVLKGHTDTITRLAWSARTGDGQYTIPTSLAARLFLGKQTGYYTKALLASGSRDGSLKIWDVEQGTIKADFQNIPVINPLFEWSLQGYFAYADKYGFVHVFKIAPPN